MKKWKRNGSKKKGLMNWENAMKIVLAGLAVHGVAYADIPVGLVGGETLESNGYAADVFSNYAADVFFNESISSISGLPDSGSINSVGLNSSGVGLIGGRFSSDGYAAFVSPAGNLTPLTLSLSGGTIGAVAINKTEQGLVGGQTSSAGYAAFVSSDGTVNPVTLTNNDIIRSVGLNDSGVGLIGGEGTDAKTYAAYVTGGTESLITTPSEDMGTIHSVAVNDLGNGIIGGWYYNGMDVLSYAAFVTPTGGMTVCSPTPMGGSTSIQSVAINHSGSGLIGGTDDSNNAYAGYVASDGSVTTLFGSPFSGGINEVALNDSGIGIIGGQNGSDFYAAFVQSDGTLTPLFSDSIAGIINSTAINEGGVALIGGQMGGNAYAALVAPNGTLTPLNLVDGSTILSVALQEITSQTQSSGPYSSVIYTQLAAAAALETRLIQQNRVWRRKTQGNQANIAHNETNLAYNEVNPSDSKMNLAMNPKRASTPKGTVPSMKANSFWLEPFGDFVHLKAQGSIPSYRNDVGGVLLGYDHQGSNYIVGATLGYAFNYIHYSESLGHGKINEEMAALYGCYYVDHFWFDAALWGGIYQFSNTRHTLSVATSKGTTDGWILQPHFEMATPWAMDRKGLYYAEPFVMFDWVNNWQSHFAESGSSGMNLQMPNVYNSLLQSEAGLRFYERFVFGWGDFCMEEKLSYVNQAPFHFNSVSTSFVGSASSFPIAVGSSKLQNLASFQLLTSFVPSNSSRPYGGFSFQATANSSYQSYFVSVYGGIDF